MAGTMVATDLSGFSSRKLKQSRAPPEPGLAWQQHGNGRKTQRNGPLFCARDTRRTDSHQFHSRGACGRSARREPRARHAADLHHRTRRDVCRAGRVAVHGPLRPACRVSARHGRRGYRRVAGGSGAIRWTVRVAVARSRVYRCVSGVSKLFPVRGGRYGIGRVQAESDCPGSGRRLDQRVDRSRDRTGAERCARSRSIRRCVRRCRRPQSDRCVHIAVPEHSEAGGASLGYRHCAPPGGHLQGTQGHHGRALRHGELRRHESRHDLDSPGTCRPGFFRPGMPRTSFAGTSWRCSRRVS